MSIKKIHREQPETFEFNEKSMEAANKIVSNYPDGKQQSAVMALLYIAQRQHDNWIPLKAMKYIAKFLDMPYIKVYEVATFYSMYNLSPVGKYFFQAEDGIRDAQESRGLGDVYKRQILFLVRLIDEYKKNSQRTT